MASHGFSLSVQASFITISHDSLHLSHTYPWFYSRRTEPSVLSRHAKELREAILVVPYAPLSIERNLLKTSKGYIDEQGNYNLPFSGKRIRHRVPLSAVSAPSNAHDYFRSPNGNAARLFRALLANTEPLSMRDFAQMQRCSLGFASQVVRFMKDMAGETTRSLPLTADGKKPLSKRGSKRMRKRKTAVSCSSMIR